MTDVARAKVFKVGPTWHIEVFDRHGRVMVTDNTNDWRKMYDYAYRAVGAMNLIEQWGHKTKRTYPELVERAPRL